MIEEPDVSVIIASYNSRETIVACLKSLEEQRTTARFEIIVVDSSTDGTSELITKKFTEVKVYRYAERKFAGDARNVGISAAKARIVAFIDADCVAEKNWIEQILRAHESPYSAIGGAIANADPKSLVAWAAYFVEFSQWMPGTTKVWQDDIAGANMSYKREIFDRCGVFIEGTYCSDTDFHWRVKRRGYDLQFIPSILVSHKSIDRLDCFLKHEFFHGRCFATVRAHGQHFSRHKRLFYVTVAPLIPLRLFLKILLNNMRNGIYLSQFLKSSPLVALGLICWSLGEALGYA
jgi:GT2 family glycosyltransferase